MGWKSNLRKAFVGGALYDKAKGFLTGEDIKKQGRMDRDKLGESADVIQSELDVLLGSQEQVLKAKESQQDEFRKKLSLGKLGKRSLMGSSFGGVK